MKPILAVDVDGVLNRLDWHPSYGATPLPEGWREARAAGFTIRYNPAHGEQLLALAEETGAELTFCTTWEDLANDKIAPLVGLPRLPYVPLMAARALSMHPGQVKAKSLGIYAHTSEGVRPFVWFDDDARQEYLAGHQGPHLLVSVNPSTGLQDEHLAQARGWLLHQAAA